MAVEYGGLRYGAREVFAQLLRRALGNGVVGAQDPAGPGLRIRSGAEEDRLVHAVMRHRLAAFLHPALESGVLGEELPIDFVGLCRQAYFVTLRRNLVGMDVGEALLEGLRQRGLAAAPRGPWALLRGPSPVHPDPGERAMGLLALSVATADEPEVRDVARGLGFEPRGAGQVVWKRMGRMDLALRLHTRAPAAGHCGPLLDAAAGLERHHFRCWVGLLDIHRLVIAGGFSPRALERGARREGLERAMGSSLRLARCVLETPVPAAWRARADESPEQGRAIPPALTACAALP
ncbi:MAG: nucleotidyltransferase family protein [bacterium]|nr:nucleotidyltransferase family protein [bacterium]MCP5068655.1 nucleotidyltransferase family protein [bacterium]